MCSGDYILCSG